MSRTSAGFAERSIHSLLDAIDYAAQAEKRAQTAGLMQRMDARLKISGVLLLIIAVVTSRSLAPIMAVLGGSILLALASGIRIRAIAGTVWIPALLFTGAIALPSIFLVEHGGRSAAFLVLRSVTCATLSALLVFSTPWPALLKGLRALGVPAIAVTILGMTYRYLFSILDVAHDMLESRRSRTVGVLTASEERRMAAASAGVLLSRSVLLSREVHFAMLSRGFRGEAFMLESRPIHLQDWTYFTGFALAAASVFWFGR